MTAATSRSDRHNTAGDTRLTYRYDTPAATCLTTTPISCGNTSLYFPSDPTNLALRPVPTRVTINTGIADIESKVKYSALYPAGSVDAEAIHVGRLRSATTMRRATTSGRVSAPTGTCRVQNGGASAGSARYCTPPTDGVSYNDVTPRWAVTWDVFGTGKTSVKWNMGKYLAGAGINGTYADANPAFRAVNDLTRTWNDTNGDRRVNCDLLELQRERRMRRTAGGTGLRCAMDVIPSASTRPAYRSVWRPPNADAGNRAFLPTCRHTARSTATRCSRAAASAAPNGSSGSAFSTRSCRGCLPRRPSIAASTPT